MAPFSGRAPSASPVLVPLYDVNSIIGKIRVVGLSFLLFSFFLSHLFARCFLQSYERSVQFHSDYIKVHTLSNHLCEQHNHATHYTAIEQLYLISLPLVVSCYNTLVHAFCYITQHTALGSMFTNSLVIQNRSALYSSHI